MIVDWKNKKVAVLGLGVEGLSSVNFLLKRGARVTVFDKKKIKELARNDIKIITGENYLRNISEFDIIVRSPGVKRNLPEILASEKKGVAITSQTKIFFDLCPCPIIGVTGTKGKGTTATLIYEMLKRQGFKVYLGGNIGKPPLGFLEKLSPRSIVVLELSSFQLQDITKSPQIAVVLMITSEHLDYHKDFYEYVEAKRNILRFQKETDFAIINRDYPASHKLDVYTDAKIFQVSRERECKEGCFVRDGKIVVRTLGKLGESAYQRIRASDSETSWTNRQPEPSKFSEIEIIETKDILLLGKHNLENVCAAVMAATLAGVSVKNIAKVLEEFVGLEHRLEFVAEKNGILFYNDSLATVPKASIEAVEALPTTETLIAGGYDRGLDYSPLARYLSNKQIKTLILFPPTGARIWNAICEVTSEGRRPEKFDVTTMEQAVKIAKAKTPPHKICLLSPASASFGIFKDYKDRGEQFKKQVLKLKNQKSPPRSIVQDFAEQAKTVPKNLKK